MLTFVFVWLGLTRSACSSRGWRCWDACWSGIKGLGWCGVTAAITVLILVEHLLGDIR